MSCFEKTDCTKEIDSFICTLYIGPEYDAPDWDFESEEDRQNVFDKINSGELLWFCAKVTASKNGIPLADDYLGGCCYKSIAEFVKDGYFEDMCNTVVDESKKMIKTLCTTN